MRAASLLDALCNFSASRPWMLTVIIVASILVGAAVGGPV